jgi:enterochelin esterase-like enzyme
MRTMYRRQAVIFFLIVALLAGPAACSPRPGPTPTPTVSPLPPTETFVPTLAPTDTPVPPTPTPACSAPGTLEPQQLTSASMPAPLRFLVYLPPCYAERTGLRYPVLYLFHGAFYDENQWVRLGAPAAADRLISSGETPPFIIVMPFDPYNYQPYEYGFDEAFLKDLLPYVDAHYRTLPDRTRRAVGGLSRGSSWALHFGLSRPDLFGEIGMHSPVIFSSDGLVVEKWIDIIPPEQMPLFYLDVSENDQNLTNVRWLENILTVRGIPHEWHFNTGFHDETYWAAHVEQYLRWYAAGWAANP